MLTLLLALATSQAVNIREEGVPQGWARTLDCSGSGLTCTVNTTTRIATLTSSGGGGGGLPDGGDISGEPFVTYSATSVLAAERVLSAGNYTVLDVATPAQAQIDWQHGLTCSAGQALTTASTSTMQCTSTITASDVSCAGTCVSSAEIVSVTGAQVSSAVATATLAVAAYAADASVFANQFQTNPTDCAGGQFANAIDALGNLTCATPGGAGKVAEAFMADASITATYLTITCAAGEYVTCTGSACSCSTPAGGASDAGVFFARTTAIYANNTVSTGTVPISELDITFFAGKNHSVECVLIRSNDGGTAVGNRLGVYTDAGAMGLKTLSVDSCASTAVIRAWSDGKYTGQLAADATTASAGPVPCLDVVRMEFQDAGAGGARLYTYSELAGGAATVWPGSWCKVTPY